MTLTNWLWQAMLQSHTEDLPQSYSKQLRIYLNLREFYIPDDHRSYSLPDRVRQGCRLLVINEAALSLWGHINSFDTVEKSVRSQRQPRTSQICERDCRIGKRTKLTRQDDLRWIRPLTYFPGRVFKQVPKVKSPPLLIFDGDREGKSAKSGQPSQWSYACIAPHAHWMVSEDCRSSG